MRPAGQPPASRTLRHSSGVNRRLHRFLRSTRAPRQSSADARSAECACCRADRGRFPRDRTAAEYPHKNAHRARTDLIGNAHSHRTISDADGKASEMPALQATLPAWPGSALSWGLTAHCRESVCEKLVPDWQKRYCKPRRLTRGKRGPLCNSCA